MKIPFLIILIFPYLILAEEGFEAKYSKSCRKYVNLLRSDWVDFRNIPTFDQGPSGVCYAHAAATLIDLWRDIHLYKVTKSIGLSNPHYAALLYKMAFSYPQKSLDSGFTQDVINQVRKYGMCRFDVIEKSMEVFAKTKNISTRDWYSITEWFFEYYNEDIKKEIASATDRPSKLKEIFERYIDKEKIYNLYIDGDFTKIYQSIEPYLSTGDYRLYAKDVFKDCFRKESVYLPTMKLPPVLTSTKKRKRSLINAEKIIEQLDLKNPVGVTFNGRLLNTPYDELKSNVDFLTKVNHQAIIVGKRVRENKCQFLLKNSWGNSCRYKWECQRNPEGKELGLWINAYELMTGTDDIFFFKLK